MQLESDRSLLSSLTPMCPICSLVCVAVCSEQFLEELIEFGKSYDLIGAGYKHREEQIQRRVGTLQDEVLLLEAGI